MSKKSKPNQVSTESTPETQNKNNKKAQIKANSSGGIVEIEDEHGKPQPWAIIHHPGGEYFSLIKVMELDGDPHTEEGQAQRQMYNDIRRKIRYALAAELTEEQMATLLYNQVSSHVKSHVSTKASESFPILKRFPNNWIAEELIKRTLRNARDTATKRTKPKKSKSSAPKARKTRRTAPTRPTGTTSSNIRAPEQGDANANANTPLDEDQETEGKEVVSNGDKEHSGGKESSEVDDEESDVVEEEESDEEVKGGGEDKEDEADEEDDEDEGDEGGEPHIRGSNNIKALNAGEKRKSPPKPVEATPPPTKKPKTARASASNRSKKPIVQASSHESDWHAEVEAEIAELEPVNKGKKKAGGKKLTGNKGISKDSPPARTPPNQSTAGPSTPQEAAASRSSKIRPKMRPPPVATDDTPQTRSKKAEVVDEFDLRASRTATATAKTTSQVAKGKGKQKERSG